MSISTRVTWPARTDRESSRERGRTKGERFAHCHHRGNLQGRRMGVSLRHDGEGFTRDTRGPVTRYSRNTSARMHAIYAFLPASVRERHRTSPDSIADAVTGDPANERTDDGDATAKSETHHPALCRSRWTPLWHGGVL